MFKTLWMRKIGLVIDGGKYSFLVGDRNKFSWSSRKKTWVEFYILAHLVCWVLEYHLHYLQKIIIPKSNVILISGDGAFLSGGMSIETAFFEKKPIVVVIDNNGGLASIGQQQESLFESGKRVATDFRDIPFHSIFEGFGGSWRA